MSKSLNIDVFILCLIGSLYVIVMRIVSWGLNIRCPWYFPVMALQFLLRKWCFQMLLQLLFVKHKLTDLCTLVTTKNIREWNIASQYQIFNWTCLKCYIAYLYPPPPRTHPILGKRLRLISFDWNCLATFQMSGST